MRVLRIFIIFTGLLLLNGCTKCSHEQPPPAPISGQTVDPNAPVAQPSDKEGQPVPDTETPAPTEPASPANPATPAPRTK